MWKLFLARTLAGSVMIYTGISGLSRFAGEYAAGDTLLQRLTAIGIAAYGVAGVVAAVALLLRHRWAAPAAALWAVSIALTGGIAPVAYGGTSVWVGLGTAAVVALIASGIVWLARFGSRPAHS